MRRPTTKEAGAVSVARMRAPIGSFEDARPAVDRLEPLAAPVARVVREGHGAELLRRPVNCAVAHEGSGV